jgi:hypothetical protein
MNNNDIDLNKIEADVDDNYGLEDYEKAEKLLNSFELKWSFRSIELIVNEFKVGLNQLRGCLFEVSGKVKYDIELATKLLIMAGLINKDKNADMQKLEDRAYEIMDEWRENVGAISILHLFIINVMEKKHFFMGETEGGIMSQIMKKGVQPEIYSKLMGVEAETRINQMKAMM